MSELIAEVPISTITIGHDRIRQDMGDIEALANSIDELGLLNPILVDEKGHLICGERRLLACKQMGLTLIPVRVIDLSDKLSAEVDENTCRKDFTITEMVAVHDRMITREKEAASLRMLSGKPSENFTEGPSEALVKIARKLDISRPTLEKAVETVHAVQGDPVTFAPIKEQIDKKDARVHTVHKEYKKLLEKKHQVPPSLQVIGSQLPDSVQFIRANVADLSSFVDDDSVDAIITDPPYPREYLPVYKDLAAFASRALKEGGSCVVMVGQSYLPDVIKLMEVEGLHYHWTLSYNTPGGQAVQLWERNVNTFWKPVLWFVKGDYEGKWIGDVCTSAVNDNDKRFHEWGQSESGMLQIIERFSYPGQIVCDPFCGGGTTAVVAVAHGRKVIAADIEQACLDKTKTRIARVVSAA